MDKLDGALNFNQTALRIMAKRQELLASNIANADTPNFKARDIDFNASLKAAIAGNSTSSVSTVKTSAQHLDGNTEDATNSSGSGSPLFRPTIQGSVDGNTVDMDVERNQFADNALRYEAGLVMLNSTIKTMLTAIQGQ